MHVCVCACVRHVCRFGARIVVHVHESGVGYVDVLVSVHVCVCMHACMGCAFVEFWCFARVVHMHVCIGVHEVCVCARVCVCVCLRVHFSARIAF